MSAEMERSVNSLADLRKDLGAGECSRNALYKPVAATCDTSVCTAVSENEDSMNPHYDKGDTSDLFCESSALSNEGRHGTLLRSNSDTSSYSNAEADFQITATCDANGASSQTLKPNAADNLTGPELLLEPHVACGLSKADVTGQYEDTVVPESVQITSLSSSVSDLESAANSEYVNRECVIVADALEQCPSSEEDQRQHVRNRDLRSAGQKSEKSEKYLLSKPHAGSVENLMLASISKETRDERNAIPVDLPTFPRSWSTPVSVLLYDKSESKGGSRSVDQMELNNGSRSTENGSFLQSGSSTESGPVMISGDSVERAKEILGHTSDICSTPVKSPSPKVDTRTPDGLKASGDVGLNGTSSKVGKSSSDKKKRGLSWYSVLSPTYKSRSDDFKRIFKDIQGSERLIVDYSCALQKDILVHGRLYISQSWICFYANIFRWETILTIRCKDIVKLSKERTARVIPNAIQICTKDDKYFFTSFGTRDKTFLMLDRVWKNGIADEKMSSRELWQWVHYSYGEELGLTSGDDDYISLSAEEKINFQTRVQKEESKLQKLSQRGDSAASDATKEPSVDYLTVNGSLQPSAEDVDSSIADNLSVTSADDSIYAFSEGQNMIESPADLVHSIHGATVVPGCQECIPSAAAEVSSDVEEDEDSTGDEDVDRCAGHAHFGIDVVDETLNIPVDTLFEHCFTDSPLYREFVKNKKTFDVVLSPWPEQADGSGVKVRNIAYTLSLGYSIGPKYSPSTERQIMYPESRPGQFYLVDTECVNGGIPYGENFYIVNRYCISKVSSAKCRLRITSELRYRKSVWGFVRNFIDKNATAGIIESFNVLADLLRQESDRQAQLATGQTNAVGRRKFLRRRRPVDRSPVKLPQGDIQHSNTSKQSTPIKLYMPKASSVKVKEDWHVKLTIDILVRIVCAVLILLMIFNAILFYKLWSLEATAANLLLNHKPTRFSHPDPKDSRPDSNDEWATLLSKQQVLHDSEINHWKDILSTSIQLMDEMIQALTDLRSSIDQRSIHQHEEKEAEVS